MFKRTVFPNGMRLVLVPQKDALAATVLTLVEAGSKYETKEKNGISHFLEHMCFKGTKTRPRAIDITGELDGLGAEYNAFTGHEWTGYFAKVRSGKIEKALELIADMYLNPVFGESEIEKEKGVVIEELHMYEDMPPRRVQDLFLELLYGDQPAGWNVGGRVEAIRRLTRDDIVSYRSRHYLASATVIVVAGAFSPREITESIRRYFRHIPSGEKDGKKPVMERQKKPAVLSRYKESDQTHLVLGFRAFPSSDPRRYSIEVLSDILGGGMSSRLFQKVREELGAAYYVRSSPDLSSDHGYLEIAAGVEHGKLGAVIKAVLGECRELKDALVSPSVLRRAKDHLGGHVLLDLESSDELAVYYGGQEILHEPIVTPEGLLARINAVRAEDVRHVARDIFKNNNLNCALIGPQKTTAPIRGVLTI